MSDTLASDLPADDEQTPFMSTFLPEVAREVERQRAEGIDPAPALTGTFVVFLQVASRFDVFSFGPVNIHVPTVREAAYRAVQEGRDLGGSYTRFSVLAEEERRRSGAPALNELHMLLAFMKLDEGLPRLVFGELGVSPEAVEQFARSGGAPTPELERLYSAEDAARYLDVHVETVREWIRTGRLRASRVAGSSRALRIKASDLAAVLEPVKPPDSATAPSESS